MSETTRRRFVTALAGTTAFWTMGGLEGWRQAIAAETDGPYTPRFFTPEEWRFIEAACECLFPRDEVGPGARDLAVPRFIDRQMDTPWGRGALWYMMAPFEAGPPNLGYQLPLAPRDLYRTGIAGAERYCVKAHGKSFADLDTDTQVAVLTSFEKNPIDLDEGLPASLFFEQLLANTLEGAFSDPLYGGNRHLEGWVMLGFPGARADFMDWVDQYGPAYPLGSVAINGETAKGA